MSNKQNDIVLEQAYELARELGFSEKDSRELAEEALQSSDWEWYINDAYNESVLTQMSDDINYLNRHFI